jgi:hypothetical protein
MNDIINDFQLFYQKILNIYQSNDLSARDKWSSISKYINENSEIISKIFKIAKLEDRNGIEMDYNLEFTQLQKQIKQEANTLVKFSIIVLALHHIIYDLMSSEGNYYQLMNSQNEMRIPKKNITYYIYVSSKVEQNIQFHAYILLYSLESLFNKNFYIGMDFEYTLKKIQLAQMNFEHKAITKSIVMLINPNELESTMINNFVDLIICNQYIKKILHGADSLDIPYIYVHMLQNDTKKIIAFTKSLIDTRLLCEYYKLNRNEVMEYRCSIYDEDPSRSAVYYFSVISKEQQHKLTKLFESLPPPREIEWNIHKLLSSQFSYAVRDVIYLKWFFYKIVHDASKDGKTDLDKKAIIRLYKYVLTELTQLVFLENNGITFLKNKCKEEVDIINNYFIRKTTGIVKMIDIYNQISSDLSTTNPKVEISRVIKVNHFKSLVLLVVKRIIYGFISQKCRVYKDKLTVWSEKLNNQFIFDFLSKLKFWHLYRMFKELSRTLETRVKNICNH